MTVRGLTVERPAALARRVDDAARDSAASARWALGTFLIAEVVALVAFMSFSRDMWFVGDEWLFLAGRTGGNLGDLFRPHYDHWVTVPVLVYRAVWWCFGLRYFPYRLMIIVLHLVAALLARVVMRRVGVRPWIATAVALVLVFFGSDPVNLLVPFQISLVGSLVFGFAQLLLATHDGPPDRRDALGLLAGCAALMCSAVGVATAIAVGVAVSIRRGRNLALLHTAPLALAYLTWYGAIGRRSAGGISHTANIADITRFATDVVGVTFREMGQLPLTGALLFALLVAGLAIELRRLGRAEFVRRFAIVLGLLVGALAFLCITGVGRAAPANFGRMGDNTRYTTVVAAFVLPALAVAVDAVARTWRAAVPVLIALLLAGIPGNVAAARDFTNAQSATYARPFREMMLSLPYSPIARQVPRDVVPDYDGSTHVVTIGWLLDAADSGRIPRPRHISPEQDSINEVRLSFRQRRYSGVPADHYCADLRDLAFELRTGESIVVGAADGVARIRPTGYSPSAGVSIPVITLAGSELEAVRTVRFNLYATAADARVCYPGDSLRSPRPPDAITMEALDALGRTTPTAK